MAMSKRKIEFASFDEAINELNRLNSDGYVSKGQWNLAQVATHLEMWLAFPIDGFPKLGMLAPVMWVMRKTIAPGMLKSILADGFKSGNATISTTVPSPDCATENASIEKLTKTIVRFQQFNGVLNPSPLFGDLDKLTATQLQLRHFEHHIGFLYPKDN